MIAAKEARLSARRNSRSASRLPTLFGNWLQNSANSRALSDRGMEGVIFSLGGVGEVSFLGETVSGIVAGLSVECPWNVRASRLRSASFLRRPAISALSASCAASMSAMIDKTSDIASVESLSAAILRMISEPAIVSPFPLRKQEVGLADIAWTASHTEIVRVIRAAALDWHDMVNLVWSALAAAVGTNESVSLEYLRTKGSPEVPG